MNRCVGSFLGFDLFVARDRGSLRLHAAREDGTTALRVELPLRVRADAHLGVKVDPVEGAVLLTVGVGATLYVGVESRTVGRLAARLCPDHKERAVEAYVTPDAGGLDGWHAHWRLWTPVHEWDHRTPRWRDGSVFLWSIVFGDATYTAVVVERVDVEVPLAERLYVGTARVFDSTWTRPRWPFGAWAKLRRVEIEIPEGIPVPGKGESAHDLDDDAIYGQTTPARDVPDAIGRLVTTVLSTRQRHGGLLWRPVPKPSAAPEQEGTIPPDAYLTDMLTGCQPPSKDAPP